MTFDEVLDQVRELLRQRQRLSYQALKRRFDIDDAYLDDLKAELIEAEQAATDENGRILVWAGENAPASLPTTAPTQVPSPVSYTPQHLVERIRAEQVALEARGSTDGERKTITALFADLKGSTALIEGLDPEEARAIIDPALQVMMEAVHRYEGYVAQALGDGIFALFGAPIAHEDHPQRALYAALRMQEEMHRYADTLRGKGYPPLLMRVGVNTGEVVVRSIRKDDLHTDYVPVGHSTNLAARMEQLAAPGSILVTAYTHCLTDGYFAFNDLGKTQIKGVAEPLAVYEVVGAGPLRTRLQGAARRGLTRFVGRRSELEQLQQALGQAKAGHGQIVGVMGEPGAGKSRLFYEFKLLSLSSGLVLEAYSVSYGKASPYLPVIELLKSYFQLQPQDAERQRREKITGKVLTLDRSLEDTLLYLFALLDIDDLTSSWHQMDPQIRRQRTFAALKKLLLRESLNQPLILIFEDLHWIDSESQGLLDALSESVASAKILLLVNYRPEYRPEWGQKTYYTQLRLAPLGPAEAEEFLDALLGTTGGASSHSPGHALKRLILEKTEGTPFFMEEIVQELVEQEVLRRGAAGDWVMSQPPTLLQLPPTVQAVLAARIDRLAPDEKALLQQLAVIGREFPLSLVRQVIARPEDELHCLFAALQRKEFLYEQPAFPEVEYSFKHALTQEVAYGTVLQEQRKRLHEHTGQALEALYAPTLQEHYSDLAHHYSRSSNTVKAVEYLQLAGQQAVQRSAYTEAISHLTTALALVETWPDTPERTRQELALQIALGSPLMVTAGYTAPAVEQVYARARALCQQIGETPQLFPVLWGLWAFHSTRAEYHQAWALSEQCLLVAQRAQDPALLLEAHRMVGETAWCRGEFTLAQQHLADGITLYDRRQHHSLASVYGGDDPRSRLPVPDGHYSVGVWLPRSRAQERPPGPGLSSRVISSLQLNLGSVECCLGASIPWETREVYEWAQAAMTHCTDQGLSMWAAIEMILRGWALAEQGQGEEGIVQVSQGLVAFRATGAEQTRSYFLALLAEAYEKVGQPEDALNVLAEALAFVDKTGERFYEAELYRLKGTLTLQKFHVSGSRFQVTTPSGPSTQHLTPSNQAEADAEGYFHQAIEIARRQQAKSLELRAVMSLSRLWQRQGKKKEAHELLSDIYGWFTEGFDTADLKDAEALLGQLA